MTRHGGAHLRYNSGEFGNAAKLTQLLHARVILVIEILPASRVVFTDRLYTSIRGRVDVYVRPRGRNIQIVNPLEISFREPAVLRLVTIATKKRTKTTKTKKQQTFDVCHGNEICLYIW